MKSTSIIPAIAMLLLLAATPAIQADDDLPPPDALPMSEILYILESQGWFIEKIEFDDGVWEVEADRGRGEQDLEVDPYTGRILREDLDDLDDLDEFDD